MSKAKVARMETAVEAFNRDFPVGSRVSVRRDNGDIEAHAVKYPADILGGHTAVVWLDGISGAFALDRVTAPKFSEAS